MGKSLEGQDAIIRFYIDHILSLKMPVSRQASTSFAPFLRKYITYQILSETLIPQAERMLLRSPETALPLVDDLLSNTSCDLSPLIPAKLVPAVLAATKSSNVDNRTHAISLMRSIINLTHDEQALVKLANEIMVLPKTGKTVSPEHRAALFNMLALLPAGQLSMDLLDTLAPLISKEGNEFALTALCAAITLHLTYTLAGDTPISPTASSSIVRELTSTKLSIRRAIISAVGSAIWAVRSVQSQFSPAGSNFLQTIVPALESSLKVASANLPTNPLGFLEGYVATAVTLGPLASLEAGKALMASSVMQGVLVVSPKPSFVLNERVQAKVSTPEDERWLLRCLEVIILANPEKLGPESTRCVHIKASC